MAEKTQTTLVVFLLDRTGSMSVVKAETIESFNDYVGGLQEPMDGSDPDDILFTLLQFDSVSLDKVYIAKPVKEVPFLTDETYVPRANTPLIEAATDTIEMTAAVVAARIDTPKVVVCIQTDGEENHSGPDYTWARLKTLIEEKQKLGWQFNFLGAGIDAYQQATQMGIAAASTMSYDHASLGASKKAFRESAMNVRGFAAGAREDTSYTMAQRADAGDKFAEQWLDASGKDKNQGQPPSVTPPVVSASRKGIRRKPSREA